MLHYTLDDLRALPRERKEIVAQILAEKERRRAQRMFFRLFPDEDTRQPDGSIIYAREKYPKHLEFFNASAKYRETCFLAANRVGKALRNGTPVATPGGWASIETLKVGDAVVAGDGTITTVTGVYPQGVKPLYRLTFDVGETIDCCGEHLWKYQHPRSRYAYRRSHGVTEANPFHGEWRVADTETILKEVGSNPIPRMRVVMPTSRPWQLAKRQVPVDPYLLGALLGDGTLRGGVSFATVDQEMVETVRGALPAGLAIKHSGGCDYGLCKSEGRVRNSRGQFFSDHSLINDLRHLGAFGTLASEKHVPRDYLLNDVPTRLGVLQGLMDTDGSITKTGAMEFSSVSTRLIEDVKFLVHSLGGKATVEARQTYYTHNGERRAGQPSYRLHIRLNICPFRLTRKAERWNPRRNTADRVLHRIEDASSGEATCISVAHPDRTFVTDHGIVTHNTWAGAYSMTCHLTGLYPDWWTGRRFDQPIRAWAAGKTNETTRDIVQASLLGEISFEGPRKIVSGTGMVPGHLLGQPTWKKGVPDLADTIKVRHVSGKWSRLGLKSYEQGRGSFEGTAQHVIWVDEECPLDVYGECLIRTATTNGIIVLTFTPLAGLSETVMQFMPTEDRPGI
jgi:phage terminase large subunit-like protein